MLKVGITGGIGVGKTLVSRVFEMLNIPVYDSDGRAKWVMRHDESLRDELVSTYGQEAFTETGDLNRAYLSKIVFNDPQRLEQLNALVHPHVRNDFTKWVEAHEDKPYIIKEAALMYESEAWKHMDRMIAVYAPLEVRLARVMQRDSHRTEADVKAIIEKQLSEDEKMKRADHIIYNDDRQMVIPQVLDLHEHFLSLVESQN